MTEPDMDLAHLAHVELLTPDMAGSLGYFSDLLGLEVTETLGNAVYLRGFEEQYHHSLKLTRAAQAGLGHAAWRVRSPAALERKVAALERAGCGGRWMDGEVGHGPAYRFRTPGGHAMEIFWEVDYALTPVGKATPLRNRPQRRPARGIPARRIDHFNLMTADARKDRDFLVDVLGFRERERVDLPDGNLLASFLSVTNLSHDVALVPDPGGMPGRFHHLCLYYTSIQHLFDLADLARERGLRIEAGPGRHGIGGAPFLFMFEPGGNRIELIGDPGYMIFDPAWRTVVWGANDLDVAAAWTGAPMPPSFWEIGTPGDRAVGSGDDPAVSRSLEVQE
ncbi:VOC family protein [Puniceibacterium confluentis]|uniref:VOC family protein n=1 Tax=Puniceibacterium confluentis TaxID=1958944 RepID=UPI0011B511FC|nr:VOC family protein [Puniceibacterium confluentis]